MDAKQRSKVYENLGSFARKCIFCILSVAALPNHVAFIMDGNRRYSKQHNLIDGGGHRVGFSSLMSMLRYCYELGVKYVTIYAFSIENFKRSPEEVQSLMDLMEEKIKGLVKEESLVNQYGVRVYFIGNLKLLSKPVRLAAERAMEATAKNSKAVLSICIAYTSSDEILHAVQESCDERWDDNKVSSDAKQEKNIIDVLDIERHLYMSVVPDPDIIIRTSDFLNFDDVDDDDAGGDYVPDVETTRVIDNTGWSSRTKAVAKYLQVMFDKEGERGRNMVCVNNLLVGKTHKEASRMFFETLVLKTKDYIHVEQPDPYENINVFPRAKLLKSDF